IAVQNDVRRGLKSQGLGRHPPEEMYGLAVADIEALAAILGSRPFLLGDRPSTADCIVFAFVHNLLGPMFDGPLRRATAAHANLVTYERRLRERLFPEAIEARAA